MPIGRSTRSGAIRPGKTPTLGTVIAGKTTASGALATLSLSATSAASPDGDSHGARGQLRHVHQQLALRHHRADPGEPGLGGKPDPALEAASRGLDQVGNGASRCGASAYAR